MSYRYGRECYCGDSVNTGSVPASEGECYFPCPGDATQTCGAGNRLNVYSKSVATTLAPSADPTTVTSSSSISSTLPVSNPPSTDAYASLGCYTEATQGRALASVMYGDDAMTVELCAAKCAGYSMFGLEYYREVFITISCNCDTCH